MKPSIGKAVHYVSYGTPGGEYESECRTAIITEVTADPLESAGLCVLNPAGLFFNRAVPHDELPPADKIVAGERTEHRGGTWHFAAHDETAG